MTLNDNKYVVISQGLSIDQKSSKLFQCKFCGQWSIGFIVKKLLFVDLMKHLPTVRKNCDSEKLLNFEAEGQYIICKRFEVRTIFVQQNGLITCSWRFLRSNNLIQNTVCCIFDLMYYKLEFKLEKKNSWDLETCKKSWETGW